jgi:pyruvate kinase
MTQKLTYNRTKIIATVGPACENPAILQELILAGVDIFRLNLSHGDWEKHRYFIREIRRLNLSCGRGWESWQTFRGPRCVSER